MSPKIKTPKILPNLDNDSRVTLGIIGCFAAGGLILLSVFGRAGSFGDIVKAFSTTLLGKGAFLLPLAFFVAGSILIKLQKNEELREDLSGRLAWGMGMIISSVEGFLNFFMDIKSQSQSAEAGGMLGFILYPYFLGRVFGDFGSFLILFTVLVSGLFLITNMTFVQFVEKTKEVIKDPGKVMDFVPDIFEIWRKNGKSQKAMTQQDITEKVPEGKITKDDFKSKTLREMEDTSGEDRPVKNERLNMEARPKTKKPVFNLSKEDSQEGVMEMEVFDEAVEWKLPPFDILKESKSEVEAGDTEGNKKIIKETLENFGIAVEMDEAIIGPTVTQYRLKPANGVRLSAIDKLQRDLALALAAPNIRIEAPIAGLSLVGIEVPNKKKSDVRLRDIIQTNKFVESEGLAVAVGKDVAGNNIIHPISKMPHLLVAGATGSGKSVWINGMLLSLLYRYTPKEMQLILVDMKRVELKLYDGVPHLLAKVITDAEKAINALKWTVLEMDRRYKILEDSGKRNIQDYNLFAKNQNDLEELPYIVFIIDELGDLMMLAKSEVEPIVVRLTQMSRAVGIHVVLGTQRPDTNVITGLIKANIPTRIAFAVASQIDSRVILDSAGAEKLLGQGDGLMVSPSAIHPVRFQGPNVEELEVKRCVDFLKRQRDENHYITNETEEVTEKPKVQLNVPGLDIRNDKATDETVDEDFEKAKQIVVKYQKASASFLQQIMGIGYPKAAKYIMKMEEIGLVGPQNGSKPRDVYMENYDTFSDDESDFG